MNIIISKPFYFVRSGETNWHNEKLIIGQHDLDLNQNGIDQASNAGYILADFEISKIYISPRKRAFQTAKIISDICELEIEICDGLNERSWGELEGKKNLEISPEIPSDVEKTSDFEKRIFDTLNIILNHNQSTSLIISHKEVFNIICHTLAKKEIECKNGQVFIFSPPLITSLWEVNEA